ncbi:RING finger protein 17 isoform X1 [Thunnus thynnus]|uniref:RING finger protein 17 isoform X1 n=2 Tax=Thunnus thynnus TaxID=8237 RepID=UPI003528376C
MLHRHVSPKAEQTNQTLALEPSLSTQVQGAFLAGTPVRRVLLILKMDRGDNSSAVSCKLCGEAFYLPEDEVDGNLPRVLLCGHIYCTSCLRSMEFSSVIRCPECEVESSLPEGGVCGLQEDSRIIGLIYTAKMNKMKRRYTRRNKRLSSTDINANTEDVEQPADIEKIEKAVDEALARAAENLAQLEHMHETLTTGLAEQVKRERARLVMEIKQAADKAVYAVQKWKDVQLNQLTKLEEKFSASQSEVCRVQERMKALEIAMQMAREVRRVPFLEQYCTLDKVLETLQAPVDNQSFDMKCITLGSGMSCVFQSEGLNQSLALSLKMEVSSPRHFSESPLKDHQPGISNRNSRWQHAEGRNSSCIPLGHNRPPNRQKQDQESLGTNSLSSRESSPSPRPRRRSNLSRHSSVSDLGAPDVIIEELLDQGQEHALPPTGPELANDKLRINRRRKNPLPGSKRNVSQWVVVTHVVNPSHFYVRYVAERRESEILSKKIYHQCCRDSCCFSSSDTVETGSTVFVKSKEGLWCRASVVEVIQNDCGEAVKACPVTQLVSVRVFFLDYGLTKTITIQSEDGATESSLKAVNNHLKKMTVDLGHFVPQAIRCSLKDLVPYDLTKGWSKEAQVEFQSVVGSAAVEMRLLGQDRDSLLVDLRKAPMDQSSDVPISVREYLVFIEVARFYSPVTLGRRPLLYYPPNYPKINTELNAVVSHINNPADFHIQLVDNMESLLLSAKLQDCYNATTVAGDDDLSVYCPVIGQACVARFEDKLWYRAQVIGHPGGRKVEVRYVDFGNKKILSVSDLRKIKDEFFALPSMAIHCCLSDVFPLDGETWGDACTKRFISLAHQKLVTIVATGRVPKTEPLPVRLFDGGLNGPVANIAELLVTEGLACFKERLKSKDPRPPGDDRAVWDPPLELGSAAEGLDAPDQNITGEQDEELLEFMPHLKISAKLKDLKVRVSHVNSPSSFYVQFTQYDTQLKSMCELVKKECEPMEPQDMVWKADMYCAAHINGVWERGQICCDVTSSNIAEVIRCDHGNKVKLHISNLRPLPSSLIGSLALECTLTDIRPAGGRSTWTATACDFISYYLTGASAVMTIKELKDERPVPVTLFCSNRMGQFVSIADFLASEGLALKERKPASVETVVQKSKETDAKSPVGETQADGSDGEKKNPPTPPAPAIIPVPSPSSLVSTPTPPKPAPRTIMSAEKVKTQLYLPPELPCLGHIQMTISAIGEDGLIYARGQNAECQLEQLRERIQQSMKTLPRQKPYTWKFVQGCAVIGPDMLWYRGQLLELLGGHVKVQYVDYGLVENIPVVHVYPMLLCDDVPQLCMPCQLHRINPVGGRWQQDAVALLREMLLSRCVDMQVVELPTDPRGPLTVEIFLDGLSLSRILCQHEHASMDRTAIAQKQGHSVLPVAPFLDDWDIDTEGLRDPEEPMLGPFIYPNLPQEGEQFQVRVKHLWTPNELFLWPLEGTADVEVDGETLDEALARINANIDSLSRLTNFPQGGPCLAEYSDGKYYRAKLMKFTSVEPIMILVQHVDFGSDDTLPTSKLRQMPAELLRFPSRALKVRVAGFKAPSVNRQEDVLPYSPSWSVKAAMDMIDLLHSNITASVVAQKPELTVLLYNEDGKLVHLPLVRSGLAELE